MTWIDRAALALVVATGVYLLLLGLVSLVWPDDARRVLAGFASSARAHFLELAARIAVGSAFILAAPQMRFPPVFAAFGWVLVGTTLVLLAVPWTWHRRFASWSVPLVTRNMTIFAVGPLVGGTVVLYAVFA